MTSGRLAVAVTLLLTLAAPPAGAVDLIATGSIPFDATDGTSFSPAILCGRQEPLPLGWYGRGIRQRRVRHAA